MSADPPTVTSAGRPAVSRRRRSAAGIWAAITLLPTPLPEMDREAIDTRVRFLGLDCSLPVLLDAGSITPGPGAAHLAVLAARYRLPLIAGDLRPLLAGAPPDEELRVARRLAPDAPLFGILPVTALRSEAGREALAGDRFRAALADAGIDGLALALDFPQAALRGRTGPDATGGLDAIAALVRRLRVPVLAASATGIPRSTGRALFERGVAGLIVGGAEFPGEPLAKEHPDGGRAAAGVFAGWGLPALAAVRMLRAFGGTLLSAGQIESGLDATKALALGADMVVPSFPAGAALDELEHRLATFAHELRTAMFLTGAATIAHARQVPFVATGQTREWLEAAESLWRAEAHYD